MNEGFFEKYSKVIKKRQSEKEEVYKLLKETTGIDFKEEEIEIEINKKIISFNISSVKKTILNQKNIKTKLEDKGYQIKL